MRPAWHKGKALEYQSKTECVSVPKMRTIPRRRLRPLCVLYGSFEGQGVRGCHGETEWRDIQIQWQGSIQRKLESPPMKPQASLAPLDERDRVYRALLNRLTLAPDHRENLLRRGLTDEAIERLGYKSTPWLSDFMHWPSPCWTRAIPCLVFRDSTGMKTDGGRWPYGEGA